MDLQFVRKCVKIVNDANIAELEIEEDGKRLRITRSFTNENPALTAPLPAMQQVHLAAAPISTAPAPALSQSEESASKYHEVRSPIVGTFYRASSPDVAPFVQVGDSVGKGQVLCIIEAMKIMNEIESDASGRIIRILVDDAQPVEYNQPLYLIDPS
ncbi:MAG: acetyl-CoA carboxylase biotin carboxyl carrier protein [Bacteroidota bacterium]|jgi:acetyl-CoA carboxylase biotin carboxyl carrier protein